MGLDIRPGNARWSYGGFAAFRERLATAECINLSEMKGFTELGKPWETSSGQHVTPLAPLLDHSDCDGYLRPAECEEVLPRLLRILRDWSLLPSDAALDYDIHQGYQLVSALEHSLAHGCAVVFS